MSYPDIFVPLNLHGPPNIEPKIFGARFIKRPYNTRQESAFYANLDTMNFKEFPNRGPLKHTVHIHTVCPRKLWVKNWYETDICYTNAFRWRGFSANAPVSRSVCHYCIKQCF